MPDRLPGTGRLSPAGAPPGAGELATLTASFNYTGASPALAAGHTLDDATTVVANGLLLLRTRPS